MRPFALILAASLALTALAQDSVEEGVRTPRPREKIDPKLFPVLDRYWRIVSASLTSSCPTPPFGLTSVRYITHPIFDTQAGIFRSDSEKELIVAFPGAASVPDLIASSLSILTPWVSPGVKCNGCSVHHGYLGSWESIHGEVVSTLKSELAKPNSSGYKVTIAGHSLGGALATLAYASLKGEGFTKVNGITYGAARIGNPAAANFIDGLSRASDTNIGDFIRVTHKNDMATQIWKQAAGYRHVRTEIYQEDTPSGGQSAETTFRCFGQEPSDCNNSEPFNDNRGHVVYSGSPINENNCD